MIAASEELLASLAQAVAVTLTVRAPDGELLAVIPAPEGDAADAPEVAMEETSAVTVAGEVIGLVGAVPAAEALDADAAREVARVAAELLAGRVSLEAELEGMTDELLGRYEEITLLYDLSQRLSAVLDLKGICEIALDKAAQAVRPDEVFIAVAAEATGELEVTAARGAAVEAIIGRAIPAGFGITGHVAESGSQLLLHPHEPWPPGELIEPSQGRAVLSVPLTVAGGGSDEQTFGALTVIGKGKSEVFTAGDAKLCNAIAGQVAIAIQQTRLVRALGEAAKVQREIEIAATIQRNLLPALPPQAAGLSLAGSCVPAADVGGDYYDFLTDDQGRLSLLIADVAGHSIGSALMMAVSRSILRREISVGQGPGEALEATNHALFEDLVRAELFVTAFCLRYDPSERVLTYANGGHNLPLLYHAESDEVTELDADGPAMGIFEDEPFEARSIKLMPGDALLLYTDGVVEAADPEGIQLGDERLAELMRVNSPKGAAELIEAVQAAVRGHAAGAPPQDDITLVAASVDGGLRESEG